MLRRDFMRLSALGLLSLSPLVNASVTHAHRHGSPAADPLLTRQLPEQLPLRKLPHITNLSADDGFRAQLQAAVTHVELTGPEKTRLWLYNQQLTPLIEVTEGDEVSIQVENHLHQPTTVHWHGVHVPANQDGGPHDLIQPHQQRHYQFRIKEGNAGLHWFHPHPHDYLAEQIAHSLAGAFLVHPKHDPLADLQGELLMITDLRLDQQGQVAPHTPEDWMNGREGDLLLVNAQRNPRLEAAPGSTLRLRLINACAGRYLRLAIPQHALQLIGTDGGYLEQAVTLNELLLVPGQRCDLLVRLSEQPEQQIQLLNLPYDRDWMGQEPAHYRETETLLTFVTQAAPVQAAITLPDRLGSIPELAEPAVQRHIELSEEMPGHADHTAGGMAAGHAQHHGHGHGHNHGHGQHSTPIQDSARPPIRFMLNGETFTPGKILFEGRVNEVEEWEVFNNSHMDHPFHVHGTHFQVVAEQDEQGHWRAPAYRAWLDTVNLKPKQRLKLRLAFAEPGEWMFHCHIIEHEEMGMMASIRVS